MRSTSTPIDTMKTEIQSAAMTDEWPPPIPSPEEIELLMEQQGWMPPKRELKQAIEALEKRRAFLLRESKEIGAVEALNPEHAEELAKQLAENRQLLAETGRRLTWLRLQLEGLN